MEKKRELNKEEMEQGSSGDILCDGLNMIAGSGEKIITCSNCTKPIYASVDKHVVKCPHCSAYTWY